MDAPIRKISPAGSGSLDNGYIRDKIGKKTVMRHRIIMEMSLGRPLERSETVHHKNGNRSDNRLVKGHELECPDTCCNLELWSNLQPPGQRVSDKIVYACTILTDYGYRLHEDTKELLITELRFPKWKR
jgi:hypothetical protein